MNPNCYVYKLEDKINGKYYIGSNYKKNSNPSHIGTSYFTSSKIVRNMFRENPNRFTISILFIGYPDEVIEFETFTLKKLNARKDERSYNCHNNENELNSRKIGKLTHDSKIGVHGRSKEKILEDCKKAGKVSCELRHMTKDSDGKSIFAKMIGSASHLERDERGKSIRMIKVGKATMAKLHSEKNLDGKSLMVMRKYTCSECGYSHIAMMIGKHQKKTGHSGKVLNNEL